jgi:hypothetical protein
MTNTNKPTKKPTKKHKTTQGVTQQSINEFKDIIAELKGLSDSESKWLFKAARKALRIANAIYKRKLDSLDRPTKHSRTAE